MGEILTVNEAALKLGYSTKYIYALIQAGELKSLKKHGRTYIDADDLINSNSTETPPSSTTQQKPQQQTYAATNENSALLDYLYEIVAEQKEQIAQLQNKIDLCQSESLKSIKEAYSKKDEQLQQYMVFLNNSTRELIASTLDLSVEQPSDPVTEEEAIEPEIREEPVKTLLNDYLINKGYDKKQRKKIYTRCQNAFLEDSTRFHVQNKKLYIYPYEYMYDDLL